jgi:hypothetical protein
MRATFRLSAKQFMTAECEWITYSREICMLISFGRLLMVDIVVNFAASLSTDTSDASLSAQNLTFKTQSSYHPLCWIDYNSQDSIERCWMGDGKVPLMDLNTENAQVQNTLNNMIKNLVITYRIDGLRVDGKCKRPPPRELLPDRH